MSTADEALIEEQNRFFEVQQQLQLVRAKIAAFDRAKRTKTITLRELDTVHSQNNTYKSVGRLFIHAPVDDLKKELTEGVAKNEEELNKLNDQKEFLERKYEQAEASLKELIAARRQKQQ